MAVVPCKQLVPLLNAEASLEVVHGALSGRRLSIIIPRKHNVSLRRTTCEPCSFLPAHYSESIALFYEAEATTLRAYGIL